MTPETKIILRELAIIHTTLGIIIKQQDAVIQNQEQAVAPKVPIAYTQAQLKETVVLMQKRLREKGITEDF